MEATELKFILHRFVTQCKVVLLSAWIKSSGLTKYIPLVTHIMLLTVESVGNMLNCVHSNENI